MLKMMTGAWVTHNRPVKDKCWFFKGINWEIYFRPIKINVASCTSLLLSCWPLLRWIWFLSQPNFTVKSFYTSPSSSVIPSMLAFYTESHSHSSIYTLGNTSDFLVPAPLPCPRILLLLLFFGIFTESGNSQCLFPMLFCFDSTLCPSPSPFPLSLSLLPLLHQKYLC